jgi:hypothetical protein
MNWEQIAKVSQEIIYAIGGLWKLALPVALIYIARKYHPEISAAIKRLTTGEAQFEKGDLKTQVKVALDKPNATSADTAEKMSSQSALAVPANSESVIDDTPTVESEVKRLSTSTDDDVSKDFLRGAWIAISDGKF